MVRSPISSANVDELKNMVRAHGTRSIRTPQCRHRTRRSAARIRVGMFQQSVWRHVLAGLTSWIRDLVSPQPEQIAEARVGSRSTTTRLSSRVVAVACQPLAENSCSVRMPRSTPPIRF